MKIALGQVKPVTGDIEGNTSQILSFLKQSRKEKAKLVVFPETAITGYCCGALFEQVEFILQNKKALREKILPATRGLTVLVGFVDLKGINQDGSLDITNSVAIIQDRQIVGVYDKVILANDGHHEDRKYFTSGKEVKVFTLRIGRKKYTIGTPICEDAWNTNHERDVVSEMVALGANVIVCINYSYFFSGKSETRHELFQNHAQRHGIPVVMVNAAGVGDILKDILIYDGDSFVYNAQGQLVKQLSRFTSELGIVDLDNARAIKPSSYKNMYAEIFDALVFEQREMFCVIGIHNAQVHVSGGLDSSIVAAIAATAMGTDHTVFISNPTVHNSSLTKGNAQKLADALGVKLYWNETQGPYSAAMESFEKGFGVAPTPTEQAPLEAVMRTAQGISASHHFKSGIVSTPNHTEIVLGWATFHDIGSIGVHSPIGDMTKVELYKFAAYINEHLGAEVIPSDLYDGRTKPAAELADANEDPIDYWVMSGICAEIIRKRKDPQRIINDYTRRTLTHEYFPLDYSGKTIYEHIDVQGFTQLVYEAYRLSQISVFKAGQGSPIVLLNARGRGFSNRETIINGWRTWKKENKH